MLDVIAGKKTLSVDPSQFKNGLEAFKTVQMGSPVVAYKADGELKDLHMPLPARGKVELIELQSPEALEVMRHTCAHVLAQAVKALFPEAQVTIGPVIENGFYYDFAFKRGFTEDDLGKIEAKMKEIVAAKYPLRREVWPIKQAIEFFKKEGEHYKCELIQDLADKQGQTEVSIYHQGDNFLDLCRGPHLPHTGMIPAIKLMSVAGAYWRGNEKNEMLARIYGTAWGSNAELKTYLNNIEEAKKRDHRKLGTELGLFSFHPEAPAAPFFHPAGAFIYSKLVDLLRELNRANGFEDVVTPLIMSQDMWKTSGHYDNYRDAMYFTKVDERDFAVKPMNCPGHCLIYKSGKLSYRDLPYRLAEFGRVHRHERSGVTAGLFRVRSFVQDDAHIYCEENQIEAEIARVMKMIDHIYKSFGFEYHVELSTRPEKRVGDDSVWDKAEAALERALKSMGYKYKLNPGDGAFYGPKIDTHLKDSIGRTHQCGTIQLDFSMPARFGLKYTGSDNSEHTPVMIHRAVVGSLERFLGILIEHLAGKFPVWMTPTQAAVLTISDEAVDFGRQVHAQLKAQGFRVALDDSSDKLGAKVRNFQNLKVPYMLVIGAKEAQDKVLSVRTREGQQTQGVAVDTFVQQLRDQARLPA